jgi:hypothetical protein
MNRATQDQPPNPLNRDLIATITARLCCPACRAWEVHCPWTGEQMGGHLLGSATPDFPLTLSTRSPNGGTVMVALLGFELTGVDEQPAIATPEGASSVAALNRALQVPAWSHPAPPAPKLPRLLDLVEGDLQPCPPDALRFPLAAFGVVVSKAFAPVTFAGGYRRLFGAEPRWGTGALRQTHLYSWREIGATLGALKAAEKTLVAMEAGN